MKRTDKPPSWLTSDPDLLRELKRHPRISPATLKAFLNGADHVDAVSISPIAAFVRPCVASIGDVIAKFWQRRLALASADIERGRSAVARIAIKGYPGMRWAGAGWLVRNDLLVTTLPTAQLLQSRGFGQKITSEAQFETVTARITKIIPDDEGGLGFLILDSSKPLPVALPLIADESDAIFVAAVGYAFQDSRMHGRLLACAWPGVFDRFFIAPGRIALNGSVLRHDCATIGNSAGAVLLDLDSGKAAGLHIGGFLDGVAVSASAIREAMARNDLAESPVLEAVDDVFLEAAPKPTAKEYAGRKGYDGKFLGATVPLPKAAGRLKADVLQFPGPNGKKTSVLPYTHFSVVMSKARKLCLYVAVNIDGKQQKSLRRADKADRWLFDPRLDREMQFGREIYRGGFLDLGHMVRRLDPVWGKDFELANDDTFHYTNACPQHKDLNRKVWNDLEDYILENTGANDLKVTVFTGPLLTPSDPPYRGTRLPTQYWKVAVMIHPDTRKLHATAYILSQADMITGLEFAFGEFRTYQLPLATLEKMISLDFGSLRRFDPKKNAKKSKGLEATSEAFTEIGGSQDLVI